MKYRVIVILIVLALVTGNGLAQDGDDIQSPTVFLTSRADISLLDRLAAGRDLLIQPSRVIEYWPEYRYSYSAVVDRFYRTSMNDESPCDIADRDTDTGDFNLGTIAVFQDSPDNTAGILSSDEQSYLGWPIVSVNGLENSEDIPWSVNDTSWSLDLREFCDGLQAIEEAFDSGDDLRNLANTNIGGVSGINIDDAEEHNANSVSNSQSVPDRQNLYFVTSQALPDQNLEFERVRIQPLPQN